MSLKQTYAALPPVNRLEEQISEIRAKIDVINQSIDADDYTGNRFDDTLLAVSADSKRDYWERKLIELESLLDQYHSSTRGMASKKRRTNGAEFGDEITLERVTDAKRVTFRLTERVELYPEEKCITPNSPMGIAVLGKQPGEIMEIQSPRGDCCYMVISINRG